MDIVSDIENCLKWKLIVMKKKSFFMAFNDRSSQIKTQECLCLSASEFEMTTCIRNSDFRT
jgi:hypothetical protein